MGVSLILIVTSDKSIASLSVFQSQCQSQGYFDTNHLDGLPSQNLSQDRFAAKHLNDNITGSLRLFLCQRQNSDKVNMSRDMRFPTMWYVRPAQAQTSLRIRAV